MNKLIRKKILLLKKKNFDVNLNLPKQLPVNFFDCVLYQ